MSMDFNQESEKPQFMYKRNPLVAHGFQIFMFMEAKGEYEPVGEYTLLDMDEDLPLTEKKVINIISILNGRQNLVDLGDLTKARVLFTIVPKRSEVDPTKILFRDYDGNGPSQENAVLVIEKGVLNDSQLKQL